jgi:PAS domain S-box-containing protein
MNDSHDTRNMATERKLYHVLVLEDDDAHIELIRRGFQLAAPTYTLTFAQSVKDARAALLKNPPDLIIADWLLPDGKGIDILPRKDGQITTPLVITTSHGNEKLAVDMLKSGAIDYVVKSEFTFKYLPRIAERALKEWESIRERKRAEEALRKERELAQQYLDTAGVIMVALNTEGIITLINKKGCEILGYEEKELIGRNWFDVCLPQKIREEVKGVFNSLISGNIAPVEYYENVVLTKDGNERDIAFHNTVLYDQSSEISGILFSGEDITDRKQAESSLKESEQFLENIVEQIPDMIFLKDAENLRFVRFNKAGEDLLGYSREELRGKNDYDFFPKAEADHFTGKDREVLRTNQLMDIPEERIQTRNMGERILHTKKIPLVDEEGKPKYLLGISEDITERKQAEERINLANRKLDLMTDVTFQDIQNKVTALRGYIEIGKEKGRENERIALLEKEEVVLESIHHLIRNTKEYQQMGVDQIRWIPLEPRIRMQASLISGRPDFSLDIDLHGLEIYSDPLIDRVFYNLIDNTVKHSKTFTRISFSCQEKPDGLILICEDDGVGIPPKQKVHIFDRVVGGVGKFGLFFVREFLDMSGMTIIENGEPGKGARFEITVPKGMYRFGNISQR